jgi:hypothetical protein
VQKVVLFEVLSVVNPAHQTVMLDLDVLLTGAHDRQSQAPILDGIAHLEAEITAMARELHIGAKP